MALQLKIIAADGTDIRTVAVKPGDRVVVRPGETIVILPDAAGGVQVTSARQDNDLLLSTGAGDITLAGFFVAPSLTAVATTQPLQTALVWEDANSFFQVTTQQTFIPKSISVLPFEPLQLPESADLPESLSHFIGSPAAKALLSILTGHDFHFAQSVLPQHGSVDTAAGHHLLPDTGLVLNAATALVVAGQPPVVDLNGAAAGVDFGPTTYTPPSAIAMVRGTTVARSCRQKLAAATATHATYMIRIKPMPVTSQSRASYGERS